LRGEIREVRVGQADKRELKAPKSERKQKERRQSRLSLVVRVRLPLLLVAEETEASER
jgi:hypothetical protein